LDSCASQASKGVRLKKIVSAVALAAAAVSTLASPLSYDPEVDMDRADHVPFHVVSRDQPVVSQAMAGRFDPEVDADRAGRAPMHYRVDTQPMVATNPSPSSIDTEGMPISG
jgi:hypothetical protein